MSQEKDWNVLTGRSVYFCYSMEDLIRETYRYCVNQIVCYDNDSVAPALVSLVILQKCHHFQEFNFFRSGENHFENITLAFNE